MKSKVAYLSLALAAFALGTVTFNSTSRAQTAVEFMNTVPEARDYLLIEAESRGKLQAGVNNAIDDDWRVSGGVTVDAGTYVQAMVKLNTD